MSEGPLYHPLGAGEIRLLTITSINPTIKCLLKVYSRSETSPNWLSYHALSYVWGSQPFAETISCNRVPLKITSSLFDTLKEIFLYNKGNPEERPIWIDAICLNQQDLGELKIQVPLMGDVYSKAFLVLAYLGSAQNNSDLAMASVVNLRDRLQAIEEPVQLLLPGQLARFGIEEDDHPVWRALEDLLTRPWFHRVWTLQEAVLGKDIMIGCGSKWLPWEVLADLIEEFTRKDIGADRRFKLPTRASVYQIEWFRKEYDLAKGLSTPRLLHVARKRACKEPIDHLWGILALLPSDIGDKIRSLGWVDYSVVGREQMCLGRAFFTTSGGRIGLGPLDVKKGDVVCVFYSGNPLFIIRFKKSGAEGEDAELIGEAYVHGLMREGQASDISDRGVDEEFILV
ncbi:HET-domain-containing protein [Stipitochalara longipes BDJ]|nr:HET-domain-containing protein [Stipitochalara longipes BDJ]